MKKKYKLVVHTDQYSGNFECEMCAFITGDDSERSRGRKYVQLRIPAAAAPVDVDRAVVRVAEADVADVVAEH